MQRTTRLKLNTARRIVEFCHRYVGRTSPSIAALAARLELLLEAVGSLLARRMADQQECATARNERDHLVAALRPRLIGLIRLADAAAPPPATPTSACSIPGSPTPPAPFCRRLAPSSTTPPPASQRCWHSAFPPNCSPKWTPRSRRASQPMPASVG